MNVRYSFIVPAYNEQSLIAATLRAIHEHAAALKGGYEIVVANDASTDRTAEIAAAEGARVIHVHKRQIGPVRNAGAEVARGDIFIFVDADTLVTPQALLSLERLMTDERVVAGGARMTFDRPPPFVGRVAAHIFLFLYFAARLAAGGFIFARRDAFYKAGRFDEKFFAGEEVHLSRALKRHGQFRIIKEPVVTSARKLRMKGGRDYLALLGHMIRSGKKSWQKREGLEIWYDGSREN